MRIATHPVHAGSHDAMARCGHEFVSLGMVWPENERPRPMNWHLTEKYEGHFDAAIAFSDPGLRAIQPLHVPTIFATFTDMTKGRVADWVEDACDLLVFTNWDTAKRCPCRDEMKKRVIEFGIPEWDVKSFYNPLGDVMTVGNLITIRGDKGPDVLKAVDAKIDIHTYGMGNECLRGAQGFRPFREIAQIYSGYKVYFNPGPVICGSVAEAMVAGLPVVTMKPATYTDLIEDGMTGLVAKTSDEAVSIIHMLLENESLRGKIAANGAALARRRFSIDRHIKDWNAILEEVASVRASA
jgi:hypothetical protein